MIWLIKKLLRRRKSKPAAYEAVETPRTSLARKNRPEWEATLLASLEQNNLAPSEEVILHAFDLYQESFYGPVTERRLVAADLYTEIVADVASLQALVPHLIERTLARHPFELSQIQQQEVR